MSEYTREDILKLVEENGGPEGLDLSGKDLSGIDLGREAIEVEVEKVRERAWSQIPVWFSEETQGANLQGANLRAANLQGTNFGHANLKEANLFGANLQNALFSLANLQCANLSSANLREAYIERTNLQEASLDGANLVGVWLVASELIEANLFAANLQGAFVSDTSFQNADLCRANLTGVNLDEAYSIEGVRLYKAILYDTSLKRDQLGKEIAEEREKLYYQAQETYLALKNNFRQIGRDDDASWAYVKQRQMEKMTHWPPRRALKYHGLKPSDPDTVLPEYLDWSEYGKELDDLPQTGVRRQARLLKFYARHLGKWTSDSIVEQLCGDGESIGRTLRGILLTLIIFGSGFWAIAWLSGEPQPSLMDCITFTLGQLTTADVGDLLGAENPWAILVRLLSAIEAFIGIALTGLLGFVLGNRIRRS